MMDNFFQFISIFFLFFNDNEVRAFLFKIEILGKSKNASFVFKGVPYQHSQFIQGIKYNALHHRKVQIIWNKT